VSVASFIVGLVVVVLTCASILFTMVLPRRPGIFELPSMAVILVTRWLFVTLSRLVTTYERKDSVLAPMGPVAVVGQLVMWALLLIIGFALMLESTTHSFGDAFVQSSVSLFTVGADHTGGTRNDTIDIAAGAIWVVIVALQIAYLPALYGAFNRREALVAQLESRSGLPAWGPEILIRHQLVGITDTLPEFYSSWESWSADLAESHTTYPILLLFRSPEPYFSWILAQLAVLDAAAMHLALSPNSASSKARLCLRMGFTALNRIARSQRWAIDLDPSPDGPVELDFAEFERAVAQLTEAGFAMDRSAEEAWTNFVGWRVNYESNAFRLADFTMAPTAPWSGPRRILDVPVESPRRPPHRVPSRLRRH
jgi:hypothetical protein